MCSVGFDSQFGMNVKQYQQMQQMRFGTGIRQASFGQQGLSMNTSLFTSGKANLFAQPSQTHSLSFNGVQYDNSFSMLNSVGKEGKAENDYNLKDNLKSLFNEIGSGVKSLFNSIGPGIKSVASKISSRAASLFNKITGKGNAGNSANVDKALGDIQNAQDKQTLSQAIDNAAQEGQAVDKKLETDNKGLKNAESQETKAEQSADKAEQGVETSQQGLDKATQEHEAAKSEVQTAEEGLKNAQTGVANAQNALDSAKAAATTENPNTAAIQRAEAELSAAKKQEDLAQKQLDEAKQKEAQAQENVGKSEQQLETSEQENTAAQDKLKEAKTNTESAKTQVDTSETQSNQISQSIEQGEQKMRQMDANTTADGSTDTSGVNSGVQSNVYENNGNYFVNGYQTNKDMYDAAQNMDQNVVQAGFSPGSTTDVYLEGQDEPQTFTVQNGKYLVNGQEVDSKTFVSEYNNAKANQEPGSGNDISLINDDYSKYKSGASENRGTHISGQSTDSSSAPGASPSSRPAADESGNGQVDQEFKAKNQKREEAEWEAYKASRRAKK